MKEYQTTYGEYGSNPAPEVWQDISKYFPDPLEPDGDGWTMCGSAAANGLIFWFWVRYTAP